MIYFSSPDVLDPESEGGCVRGPGERHGGVSQRGLPQEHQLLGEQQGGHVAVK